jgi:hypothetical protein
MRWLFKICMSLAFLGLVYLAMAPYLPAIRHEANAFYMTWQQIRVDMSLEPLAEVPEAPQTEPSSERDRQLITPDQITLAETQNANFSDSFILEARRRAKEDPRAAMEWLQSQHSGSERLRGMLEVVALWAADDSESALLWLESNAQGLARLETLNNGVELWAERNPSEAARWIDGMANDGSKASAAKSLAAKWVKSEPNAAAEWVSGLPNGPIRDDAMLALAESWIQTDATAASIWAFSEAEFNGNYELLRETIREFSKQSPTEAEAFVRDMAGAPHADKALTALVIGRAQNDPSATAQWLTKMSPEDPLYTPTLTKELMQVWAESDSIAASEWLSQQAPGTQRDAAIQGFSQSIQDFEPEAAATWANAINAPEQRLTCLTDSIVQWSRHQPHAALEWVQSAELAPAVRTQLANQIGVD